jgi:hypothetical protein
MIKFRAKLKKVRVVSGFIKKFQRLSSEFGIF